MSIDELLYLYYCNRKRFEDLVNEDWREEDFYDDRKGHSFVEALKAMNFIRDEIVRRCER